MPQAVQAFAGWLNTWNGVGAVVAGMTALGHDLELQQPFAASESSHFPRVA